MTETQGGCLCGAVRFATNGAVLFCTHCHCGWCRKAHGAAFVTWYGVKESSFELTAGADTLKWFQSSAESARGFCSTCGTTLFFRSTIAKGEMHIALACADADKPIGKAPTSNIFWDAHVAWIEGFDELPKYDRDHPSIAGYQAIAKSPESKP